MTPSATSLDAVDHAFLWHADRARRRSSSPTRSVPSGGAPRASEAITPLQPTAAPMPAPSCDPVPLDDDATGTLVDRLLRCAPQAWAHLSTRVEDAVRDGARVIAIAGARRGEGRTTLVECLARSLTSRGHRVACHDRVPLEVTPAGRDGAGIVLVDAGVWFPGGPLRRAWLERQSLGCHAVILVRRGDQPACAARGAVLEAVGLTVLGEVLTMVPPTTSGIRVS